MKVLCVSVLTSGLLICGSLSAFSQPEIPKDLSITLRRTMCFGWCPAYTLTIAADGGVKFTPEGAFSVRGDGPMPMLPLTSRLAADQISDLLAEFQKIKFFSLQKHYRPTGKNNIGPSCPEYSTDSPSAVITIVKDGKRKTVNHYLGCVGSKELDQLLALEHRVDDTAHAKEWISLFGWVVGSVVDLVISTNELVVSSPDRKISVKAVAVDPEGDVLTYQYTVSGGKIIGTGPEVLWDLTGAPVGTYTITAGVDDGCGICGKTMNKTVTIK